MFWELLPELELAELDLKPIGPDDHMISFQLIDASAQPMTI